MYKSKNGHKVEIILPVGVSTKSELGVINLGGWQ